MISVVLAGNVPVMPNIVNERSCADAVPFLMVSFVNDPGILPIAVPPVTMDPAVAFHSATATSCSGIHNVSANDNDPSDVLPLSVINCFHPSEVAHP